MRWVLGTVLGLVLVCSSVRADLNPQQLASFRLDRFPALQGFQASRPGSWRVALLHDRPSQATATLNCRYFHGPTEISYTVLLFPRRSALEEWDRLVRESTPAWFTPLKARAKGGVQERMLGGLILPSQSRGRAAVVRQMVITLRPHQHAEMIRRNPGSRSKLLSGAELSQRVDRVWAELLRLAKALPANR